MSDKNELAERKQLPISVNAGAVAIEQERAIAEAQGQIILAKRFPRDMGKSFSELMDSCSSILFAQSAFYSVPNRGSGPSIRFAEEVARVYGNFVYGHKELSRSEGKSEVEVFAWDMEKNNRSTRQITIMHSTDTKDGPRKLTSQADIDNRIANIASKQIRGRILALLPKSLVSEAIEKCKRTLEGESTEPISSRVWKMIEAFQTKFGVHAALIESYIGCKLDDTTIEHLIDLRGVFNALREGAKVSDYFGKKEEPIIKSEVSGAIAQAAASIKPVNSTKQTRSNPVTTSTKKDPVPVEKEVAEKNPVEQKPQEQPVQESSVANQSSIEQCVDELDPDDAPF